MENKFEKYARLTTPKKYDDTLESYQLVMDTALELSRKTQETLGNTRSEMLNDALILFQMSMTKAIAIKSLAQGINYYNSLGDFSIANFVDPMSMASLVRSQYEAFANFHNIFNLQKDKDAQDFLYYTWAMAGLRERQRFPNQMSEEELKQRPVSFQNLVKENNEKAEHEQKLIEEITAKIHANPLFSNLDEEKQKKLDKQFEKRTFQFLVVDGVVKGTDWLDMFLNTGVNELFKPLYSIMSTSTHPSNVSVFQYAQMFENNENQQRAQMLLKMSEKIMSFFIADFCGYVPEAKVIFQSLPEMERVLVESSNQHMRNGVLPLSDTLQNFSREIEEYVQKTYNGDYTRAFK
ncbi:MAG: DUF5677 domain-containing protein [Bacteroidota bacterium]